MAAPKRRHRVEISADPNGPEKIVIHCREVTDDIRRLQAELEGFEFSTVAGNTPGGAAGDADNAARTDRVDRASGGANRAEEARLSLKLGDQEHLVAPGQILFFESEDGKVTAHTAARIYRTEKKLYELEEELPKYFMRVSKGCVLNLKAVSWLKREFTGPCRVGFTGSDKQAYVSRMYFKPFRAKLDEMNGRVD